MNSTAKSIVDSRIEEILALISQFESGKLDARRCPSERDDGLDQIIAGLNGLAELCSAWRTDRNKTEQRLRELLEMMMALAALDFDFIAPVSEAGDRFDALAVGLNALGEELHHSTVSRSYLDNILNSMTDTLVVVNLEGLIQTMNQATLELLGYTQAELIGRPLELIFAPTAFKEIGVERLIEAVTIKGVETTYQTKEGRHIPVSFSASMMPDERGQPQGIVCVAHDISERKRAQAMLSQHEQQLEVFFSQSLDGFFFMMLDEPVRWDDTVDKEAVLDYVFNHQRITRINEAMLAQYGATREQFLGLTPADLFARDLLYGKSIWRSFFDRGWLQIKTNEQKFDGTPMWVEGEYVCLYNEQGLITGHFGIQREVTEQKRAEERLRQSQASLAEAQRIAHLGNWSWNIITNELSWSDEIYRIFGLTPQEFEATYDAFLKTVHPVERDIVQQAVNQAIAEKKPYSIDHRIVLPTGEVRIVHERGEVTFDTDDRPIWMVGTVQDITEQKQTELQLKASLEEKEVLLKEIHHRVKNNLQIVSSLLDLQTDYVADEPAREAFRESQQRIKSMALIHERLYQSQDLARINFADYVESLTAHLLRSYGGKASNASVHLNIAPLSLSIETAIPCSLIINELVSNAIKHAFPNGRSGQIEVALGIAGDHQLTLQVGDNGIGFPVDIDFRRTTSLGLTLVMTLVKQLKGEIDLQNKAGAQFKIIFTDSTVKVTD